MKPIKMFYQTHCPFCKRAQQYIDELKQEYPEFQAIEIEKIEENEQPEIADRYDYYYVPTFYIDEVKVHEAGIFKNEMEALLRKALEA
jgi:thiol-disulfide isomerase/thioredoxin